MEYVLGGPLTDSTFERFKGWQLDESEGEVEGERGWEASVELPQGAADAASLEEGGKRDVTVGLRGNEKRSGV
jgi:hypothetical protein